MIDCLQDPKFNTDLEDHPLAITKSYIRAVSIFGPIVEVRSGQGTQDLPIFVRFIDKDSEWTYRNGLPTLITSLLQMNLVGYGFILPDMIGGNGYLGVPSEELFLRWLQANVFMPSLQYSYVPWDYSKEAIEISRKFTDLHAQYTDEIMEAFEEAVKTGEPVNAPIWWIDPNDQIALATNDGIKNIDVFLCSRFCIEAFKFIHFRVFTWQEDSGCSSDNSRFNDS